MMQPFTRLSLTMGTIIGTCLLCATGCSPRIYTRVEKSYPANSHDTEVIVFQPEETPPPAETLGHISIGDAGMPETLGYDDVLDLARVEVRKIGGNGLHVTCHIKPSPFGSTCHQIEGRMLCFADSVYAQLLSDHSPLQDTTLRLTATETPPATLSDTYVKLPAETHPTPPADTVVSEEALPAPVTQRRHTLYAHVGYAFIYSEVATPENVSGNPRQGFDFNLGYNCLLNKGWGVGARYSRYSASLTGTIEGATLTDHISLQYFGPEVTLQTVKHRWTIGGALGLGYAHYQEKVLREKVGIGGFGSHLSLHVEYLLGHNIGLGVNIGGIAARFNAEGFGDDSDDTFTGIGRISLTAGLRVHF